MAPALRSHAHPAARSMNRCAAANANNRNERWTTALRLHADQPPFFGPHPRLGSHALLRSEQRTMLAEQSPGIPGRCAGQDDHVPCASIQPAAEAHCLCGSSPNRASARPCTRYFDCSWAPCAPRICDEARALFVAIFTIRWIGASPDCLQQSCAPGVEACIQRPPQRHEGNLGCGGYATIAGASLHISTGQHT
jgi:hypothetical protein